MFHTEDFLKAFKAHRGDAIVVPGRGGKHWVNISDQPELDLPMGDPAMGGHAGFAFGLAMAQPKKRVVLFDSEGDLQMALGILLTIAEQKPANFYHFMLDNECYATTGGQPVPRTPKTSTMKCSRRGRVIRVPIPLPSSTPRWRRCRRFSANLARCLWR